MSVATTPPVGHPSFPKEENWVTLSLGSVVFQIILYGFKYAPGAFEHCPVLKSEHVYSFLFSQENRTSLVIIRTGIVHFSIQFDCQLDFRAIEVYNIGSDALLPSEFQAIQLFAFQHPPKDGFGGCGMVPQGLPIFFVFFFVHQGLHKRYRFARLVLIVCHKVICRYHPARWAPLLPGGGELGYHPAWSVIPRQQAVRRGFTLQSYVYFPYFPLCQRANCL